MSKKMIKRSLALGALMAFVITGSAYAEQLQTTLDNNFTVAAPTDGTSYGHKDAVQVEYNKWQSYMHCELNGFNLTFTTGFVDEGECSFGGFNITDNNASKQSQLIVNGGITGKGTITVDALSVVSNSTGIAAGGSICVDELKITSVNNAIDAARSGGLQITANNIELTVGKDGNAVQVNNDLNINSDVLKITNIEGSNYQRTIRVAGATAEIEVGTLNISGGTEAGKVTGNGTLNLSADAGSINSNFVAGEDGSKGTLNMTLGSGVTLTGSIKTDAESNSVTDLDLSGTWNLTEASSLTNATFNSGSTLVIDGKTYANPDGKNEAYALNGVGDEATLTVANGAKLNVTGIKETTYNVATGFAEINGDAYWTVGNMADLNNNLMEGKWLQDEAKNLQLQIVAKEADTLATEMGVSQTTAGALSDIVAAANNAGNSIEEGSAQDNVVKFAEAIATAGKAEAGQAVEAVAKMAEAGGNSATAANIVKNVTGVTNDRLSFNCGHSAPHKGGHGVGLFEEGSGADVWVEYVHGKDEVEDMKSTAGASSYEGQYNGIVMGVDFKKVNKFQSGIAFNYGEGDTNSVGTSSRTHSDYDFWGIGYYGGIHNDDSNVIFDINYAKSDSDVSNYNLAKTYEASPETTTWTAGVKVEKLYQNENVTIVPYTGLRYMSIDADDYATKCGAFSYKMERQDIWLLPVGVSIKQEVVNDNGWTVSPRVDLSYIWAFGDTDSNMEFATALNTKTNIGYDVMDDGSFLGLVGIEAHKGQWGYGVAYSYQKGDHSTSKKWYVDVNYSF